MVVIAATVIVGVFAAALPKKKSIMKLVASKNCRPTPIVNKAAIKR
jgi:hypothetical protein